MYNIKEACEILGMTERVFKYTIIQLGMTKDKIKGTRYKYSKQFLTKLKKGYEKNIANTRKQK